MFLLTTSCIAYLYLHTDTVKFYSACDAIHNVFLAPGGVPSAWAAFLVSWLGGDRAGEQPRLPIGWSRLRCLVGQLQVQNFYACNLLKTKQNYFELEANVESRLIFHHGTLTTCLHGFIMDLNWISSQLNMAAWVHSGTWLQTAWVHN